MHTQFTKIIFFVIFTLLLSIQGYCTETDMEESRIRISMRLIGHQLLLHAGDSTSIVLPVEKEKDRYKIQFENEFYLNPQELSTTINKVILETGIAKNYIVEVESCETGQVVHGFEVRDASEPRFEMLACGTRDQPKECYELYFTILDGKELVYLPSKINTIPPSTSSNDNAFGIFPMIVLTLIPFLLFLSWLIYSKKKSSEIAINSNLIPIGEYQFDKKNMLLLYNDETTVLTSKEADLLYLLYNSENTTLERENILKVVWGDEGDYVGRTLDVFISKLRKKLSADSGLKIVNIRGVGYKFIIN